MTMINGGDDVANIMNMNVQKSCAAILAASSDESGDRGQKQDWNNMWGDQFDNKKYGESEITTNRIPRRR